VLTNFLFCNWRLTVEARAKDAVLEVRTESEEVGFQASLLEVVVLDHLTPGVQGRLSRKRL
jgi:hypothetical protein